MNLRKVVVDNNILVCEEYSTIYIYISLGPLVAPGTTLSYAARPCEGEIPDG